MIAARSTQHQLARVRPLRSGLGRIVMVVATLAIALTGLVAVPPPAAHAAVVGDDYPAYLASANQDALVDPWRFYNRECTSFVAWRLNNTNGVPFTNQYLGADLWWGNANTWGTSARAKGVLVDNTPAVGSVAWSTAGKYGHVSWVAEVLEGGKVVVEEYNWGVNTLGEKGRYRQRTALASSFTGFIHVKDLATWPPSDGAFINVVETGEVYRMAGGAPLYVSDWAIYGGPQRTQNVTAAKFDTLAKVPKNGTYIRGESTGHVYSVAHGAPIHVATWAGVGGEKPTIGVDDAAISNAGRGGVWRFLKAKPSDGFLRGASSYRIFRVIEGRPYYVSSWGPYGGEQTYVSVDDVSINSCDHLNCDPVGGLDSAVAAKGALTVRGWGQDPNTADPVKVHVYVDGAMVGEIATGLSRPDLEAKYHRGLNYGYEITVAATPGSRSVCTYAINAGLGENNTHLGCTSTTVPAIGAFTASPAPTVAGTVRLGKSLTATTGTWKPAAGIALQWKADGTVIPGATGSALTLTDALVGKAITVEATATLSGYTPSSKSSAPTPPVAPLSSFVAAPTPIVSGTVRVGSTLTGTVGTWRPSPASSTVGWLRGGQPIAGASSTSYTLVPADMGAVITFAVTSTTRGYLLTKRVSAPTGTVIGLPLSAAPIPTISGRAAIGQALTAATGSWAPGPVGLSYQWLRNGAPISGASAAVYSVTASDVNAALSVRVTGAKSGYSSATQTSISTVKVPPLVFSASPAPTISGISRVGQSLTAALSGWSPAPAATTFQWKRAGTVIPGATAQSYTLAPHDVGQVITVSTSSAKPGFTSVTTSSAGTAKVAALALTGTPVPAVSGTAKVGQTVTAKTAAWTPSPVALTYQWNRNGTPITGATTASYRLAAADKGAAITVTVIGSRLGYASAAKSSAPVTAG
jgi:surface antigen